MAWKAKYSDSSQAKNSSFLKCPSVSYLFQVINTDAFKSCRPSTAKTARNQFLKGDLYPLLVVKENRTNKQNPQMSPYMDGGNFFFLIKGVRGRNGCPSVGANNLLFSG